MSTRNSELFEGPGSVMPVTPACNHDVGQELDKIARDSKETGRSEESTKILTTVDTGIHEMSLFYALCLYSF